MGSPIFDGFQRILVAFDGSPHAEHALNVAFSMAGDAKATLNVLTILRPPEPTESAEFHAVLDDERDHIERCFGPMRERAKEKEIELEAAIAVGHPAEQIIYVAEKMQASSSWASAATRYCIAGCSGPTQSEFSSMRIARS
jgi:nucleotide-binding universal stress UspA family protein